VNVNQLEPRNVLVQAGGYAEHRFTAVKLGDKSQPLDGSHVTIKLAPGAGARLTFAMSRYSQVPTMAFPWQW
jgi:hypothetical protein